MTKVLKRREKFGLGGTQPENRAEGHVKMEHWLTNTAEEGVLPKAYGRSWSWGHLNCTCVLPAMWQNTLFKSL